MKMWSKNRKPDKEDIVKIKEIYRWIGIALENEKEEEWFKFAALNELAVRMMEYFFVIGFWWKDKSTKEIKRYFI